MANERRDAVCPEGNEYLLPNALFLFKVRSFLSFLTIFLIEITNKDEKKRENN